MDGRATEREHHGEAMVFATVRRDTIESGHERLAFARFWKARAIRSLQHQGSTKLKRAKVQTRKME